MELLAPAGNREKLNTAFHFGADAAYVGGSGFSLRASAENFDSDGLNSAVLYAHSLNKKLFVATNIFAFNRDFGALREYFEFLSFIKADAVIITDPGVLALVRKTVPSLPVHVSTQANVTNGYAAKFYADLGVKRIVLARELTVDEIREIRGMLPETVELECFVHGAMCISYSGRCLLSNYLSGRDSNRGECVQACRWSYKLTEAGRAGAPLELTEDARGSYILNSRDLNMLGHLDKLIKAGVYSFKIEGRMKTPYYVANVVNAYRRALDAFNSSDISPIKALEAELFKSSNRGYTTGFYFGKNNAEVSIDNSQSDGEYEFVAKVLGYDFEKGLLVEQRNRFKVGETLEILSSDEHFNDTIKINEMYSLDGGPIEDAKFVQQRLFIKTDKRLMEYDILRRKK